ncbi:Bug family tripartite tricarboxylate transporter substrate binding protein [Pararhodobacter zhoushanensis]|uniref:Tripartite tricarboxylate transporter substrate binding protein n=1 Tax=Pararhodobacter zhoushanensis TaxID=2479545 RepID=A0ABT3GXP3_9RHOB|nr:tripartite tricarboxylate transporter substrate binding protein [Pararhodobacter zhoushanensis]MCW1932314.1 tripartite tricarboxylate transporter substrate binding protein [Pararhodobacter zhoushanensis]
MFNKISGKLPRRTVAGLMLGAAAFTLLPAEAALAQSYPTEPVRIIVPFGPGGLADITMRLAGEKLSEIFGQQFIVENHPGAGGVAAANVLLNAKPDGQTLIVMSNGTTIAMSLFENLGYNPQEQFAPISTLAWFDIALFVSPGGDFETLEQVVSYAQENPGMVNIGTINPGSTQNLSAEYFRSVTGIDANIITYRTSPDLLAALIREEIDLVFESPTAFSAAMANEQARIVATTGAQRNPSLPDVPTAAEAGVEGYAVEGWNALYALAGTPEAVIDQLHAAITEITQMPDIQARFAELGTRAESITPAEMADRFESDRAQWQQVIQDAGIETR